MYSQRAMSVGHALAVNDVGYCTRKKFEKPHIKHTNFDNTRRALTAYCCCCAATSKTNTRLDYNSELHTYRLFHVRLEPLQLCVEHLDLLR